MLRAGPSPPPRSTRPVRGAALLRPGGGGVGGSAERCARAGASVRVRAGDCAQQRGQGVHVSRGECWWGTEGVYTGAHKWARVSGRASTSAGCESVCERVTACGDKVSVTRESRCESEREHVCVVTV